MKTTKKIEILEQLARRVAEYEYGYTPFMCNILKSNFSITSAEQETLLKILWKNRIKGKITKSSYITKNGRLNIWYKMDSPEKSKEVRVKNINRAIKNLEKSLVKSK